MQSNPLVIHINLCLLRNSFVNVYTIYKKQMEDVQNSLKGYTKESQCMLTKLLEMEIQEMIYI